MRQQQRSEARWKTSEHGHEHVSQHSSHPSHQSLSHVSTVSRLSEGASALAGAPPPHGAAWSGNAVVCGWVPAAAWKSTSVWVGSSGVSKWVVGAVIGVLAVVVGGGEGVALVVILTVQCRRRRRRSGGCGGGVVGCGVVGVVGVVASVMLRRWLLVLLVLLRRWWWWWWCWFRSSGRAPLHSVVTAAPVARVPEPVPTAGVVGRGSE